jgi:hypothetical protein
LGVPFGDDPGECMLRQPVPEAAPAPPLPLPIRGGELPEALVGVRLLAVRDCWLSRLSFYSCSKRQGILPGMESVEDFHGSALNKTGYGAVSGGHRHGQPTEEAAMQGHGATDAK